MHQYNYFSILDKSQFPPKMFYKIDQILSKDVNVNIVSFQSGKESKYSNNPRASVAQKVVIPLILLLSSGAAVPFFLIPYDKLAHTCTDPFKIMDVTDIESENFSSNIYSTIVTVFTYVLPVSPCYFPEWIPGGPEIMSI